MLKFHPLRVSDVRPEAQDAVCVTLDVPADLREQFHARAGQHIVVRTQVDGAEVRRTYSLVSAEGELPLRIAVRTHPQGRLSRHIATSLRVGDVLDVMPPNGSFGSRTEPAALQGGSPRSGAAVSSGEPPDSAAAAPSAGAAHDRASYVAFAAGSGITPVISVIRTLLARDGSSRVMLFYGNRDRSRAMLLEELLALKDRHLDRLALHFVMSREPQDIDLLNGRLNADKVRAFAGTLFDPLRVSQYFVCGPGTMIDDVGSALRELGVRSSRIHSERFTVAPEGAEPEPLTRDGVASRDAGTASTREAGITQVSVIMDGRRRTFTMRTDEETILDAAARAGLDLPFSCKAGVCSTCRTKLVRGQVELAQNYALEDWELEQGFILACQAHAKTAELELSYDET